jgi:hypothetical protein
VTADADDDVAQLGQTDKCETINSAPVTATPPTVQVPSAAAPDTRRAKLTLSKCQKRTLRFARFLKGVSCTAKADEAVKTTFQLRVRARRATIADTYNLMLAGKSYGRSTSARKATLKPSRRPLGSNRSFRVQIIVTVVDGGGNRTTKSSTFKVRR